MEGDWQTTTVGDVALRVTKGTTPTTIGGRFVERGINFIKVESLTEDGRIDQKKLAYVDEATNELLSRSALERDDILFTIAGTIGRVALVPPGILPANTNQAVAIVRPDRKLAFPRYLYYVLGDESRVRQAHTRVVQSVQANFSLGELSSLQIPLPPLPEQRAIAHILGTLDDKIELNRRMSETLEAMALALFKSWFVDFDPVRAKTEGLYTGLPKHIADLFPDSFEDSVLGEIPKGWATRGLDEIADFLNGLALQKYPRGEGPTLPVIKIAQLRKGDTEGADRCNAELPPGYTISDGDVLFSWSGSLECVLWAGGKGALNQHIFKVTSALYPKWFYYLWIHQHLQDFRHIAAGKATTMGHIQRHHITDAKVIVPGPSIINAGGRMIAPLIETIMRCRLESHTLGALREALLPKLVSGEIRTGSADKSLWRGGV